jgi:hypothetical protein
MASEYNNNNYDNNNYCYYLNGIVGMVPIIVNIHRQSISDVPISLTHSVISIADFFQDLEPGLQPIIHTSL